MKTITNERVNQLRLRFGLKAFRPKHFFSLIIYAPHKDDGIVRLVLLDRDFGPRSSPVGWCLTYPTEMCRALREIKRQGRLVHDEYKTHTIAFINALEKELI